MMYTHMYHAILGLWGMVVHRTFRVRVMHTYDPVKKIYRKRALPR